MRNLLLTLLFLLSSCEIPIIFNPNPPFPIDTTVVDTTHNDTVLVDTINLEGYFVATNGLDSNIGSKEHPWKSLQYAFNKLTPGDILYIRKGTYLAIPTIGYGDLGETECAIYIENKNGNSSSRYTVSNYPGEYPVIDCSTLTNSGIGRAGIILSNCSYWNIKGITVKNARQISGKGGHGIELVSGHHNTIENCTAHSNGGPGFHLRMPSGDETVFLNCDSYNNYDQDTGGGDADGFDVGFCLDNRIIRLIGCRAWDNSDDGFDMYQMSGFSGIYYIVNCWAWGHGWSGSNHSIATGDGNGFKPGTEASSSTTKRYFYSCIGVGNRVDGFNQNGALCKQVYYNCIAYANNKFGFEFYEANQYNILQNNVSFGNGDDDIYYNGSTQINSHNSWNTNMPAASISDYINTDKSQLERERQADGSLPQMSFLHLTTSSALIGAGIGINGFTFDGDGNKWKSSPSIGPFQY